MSRSHNEIGIGVGDSALFSAVGARSGVVAALVGVGSLFCISADAQGQEVLQVGFLWHMHQPIYYPYEPITDTDAAGRFSFSVVDVHNQRFGPYTTWPLEAIQAGTAMSHLGAQVSFSGSLIENLNTLESAGVGGGMWGNWDSGYGQAMALTTALGNPRLNLVAFGYHHPLMPLLDERDMRVQIQLHKHVYGQTWPGGPPYATGMFPAETAFSTRMIPALVAEGIDWVLVDNIHFDRACVGYPHTTASNLFAPNPADQVNPDPAAGGGAWVQLSDLWAPSRVSAPFGYQPHHVQHVRPDTGSITTMAAVPAARYEGNEDGRGGYGAFLYDRVMDQYISYNTDADHPMIVVLHHDGDNFGGGSEAYYHHNFQNMVAWASSDPDYDVTTIADYLDRFPIDPADVIHVENGSWVGADNGDPEFKKWLGDPGPTGWSPDRNSWAVLTAAKNRVFTADAIAPIASMDNVLRGTGTNTEIAWHFLLCSEASDYWYWDGTEIWDSNVTRGCNQAVVFADQVIAGQPDTIGPTIFLPQREPYNPGGFEWGSTAEPSDFEVWTYVHDVNGLTSVTLKWRLDNDGANPLASTQNETYAGGAEVEAWNSELMTASDVPPQDGVLTPLYRAMRYGAMIAGRHDVLIDYYVESVDGIGNVTRSDIQHVYVGTVSTGGGGGDVVTIDPDPAVAGEPAAITYNPAGRPLGGVAQVYLHYGYDGWNPIIDPDPAMSWNAVDSVWEVTVSILDSAGRIDMVFTDGAGVWDNNDGQDWHFDVVGGEPPADAWELDGTLDAAATLVASNNGMELYAGVIGDELYVATADAGEGNDHFIFLANPPGSMVGHPWAKAGQVPQWSAYLGNENDNGWAGWFDAAASARTATGGGSGELEGAINLVTEFGSVPAQVYLAMTPYPTADGSDLVHELQVPASINDDGNLDPSEFVLVDICGVRVDRERVDLDQNCLVDSGDLAVFVDCIGGPGTDAAATCPPQVDADFDDDNDVDLSDFEIFQIEFAN